MQTYCVCALAVAILMAGSGCHRSFYRRQADADATRLIQEKSLDPHWSIPNYTIEIDPRSRMFDPFSLDHPPMPTDDPSAAEFMKTVDGKPGFPHWHANGDTPYVANPEWEYMLPVDEEGILKVNLDQALELALTHSPEYQRQLETLFLSALDVSLERFDFETQFFSPLNSSITSDGRIRGGGSSSTRGSQDNGAGVQLRKAGITGSSLVVAFANSLLWEYSGSDTTVGFGSLSFELLQPLLRNAGRDVIMESLTDAERGLLYNVRQLERFKRGYAQQIVAGISAGGNVSRGSGTFANVAGVSSGAGGMLALLQTQQSIRIQEDNIASQRSLIEQFEEFFRSERIDLLQLTQFQRNLYDSESELLSAKANYQTSLDAYKISLGLPPQLNMAVSDPILDQFVLVDGKITERQNEIRELRSSASDLFVKITELITVPNGQMKINRENIVRGGGSVATDLSWTDADIAWTEKLKNNLVGIRETFESVDPIYKNIFESDFPQTEEDIEKLKNAIEKRKASLDLLRESLGKREEKVPVIEPVILDSSTLNGLVDDRLTEFNGSKSTDLMKDDSDVVGVKNEVRSSKEYFDMLLNIWDQIIANNGRLPKAFIESTEFLKFVSKDGELIKDVSEDAELSIALQSRAGTIKRFFTEPGPEILTTINSQVINVSLIQALARVDTLTLPIVEIDWQTALDVARENRRDWMNARAQLVDQWRSIEIAADDLESQLDLTFSGDLQNVGDNPLKLRDNNGRIRVGLQFDAPITRLAERNTYRESLISYQQSKRSYYQFEDQIASQIRQIVRLLDVAKLNFELARIQVKISVDAVQLASYNLVKPPQPGSSNTSLGSTVARDLIGALNGLQSNQNNLIRLWVNYEVLRRQLDFHMGTMQLDENGFWIDPIEINADSIRGAMSGDIVPADIDLENGPLNSAPQIQPVPNTIVPNTIVPENSGAGIYDRNRRDLRFTNVEKQPRMQIETGPYSDTNPSFTNDGQFQPPAIDPEFTKASAIKSGRIIAPAEAGPRNRPSRKTPNLDALYNSDFDSDRKRGIQSLIPPARPGSGQPIRDKNVLPINYHENQETPPRIAPIPEHLKLKTIY